MKTIVNRTQQALRVPLPHGKVLHLGPRKTGQISVHDADHPALKELAEAGQVEILDLPDNEAIPTHGRRGQRPF
jgi:hypothetical protein